MKKDIMLVTNSIINNLKGMIAAGKDYIIELIDLEKIIYDRKENLITISTDLGLLIIGTNENNVDISLLDENTNSLIDYTIDGDDFKELVSQINTLKAIGVGYEYYINNLLSYTKITSPDPIEVEQEEDEYI